MKLESVIFDFDGTIRDSQLSYLPPSTLLAIKKLKENNFKVFLATGRGIHILQFPGLDLSLFDGIICNNGACGYTNTKQLLFADVMPEPLVKNIIEDAKALQIALSVRTLDCTYTTPMINKYQEKAYTYFDNEIEPVKQYEKEPVLLLNAYYHNNFDWDAFGKKHDINVVQGPTTHVDLMLKNVNKYTGIQKMLKIFKLSSDYVAFGDQENDIEMIQKAAIGIAVLDKYGSPKLAEIADYVCESGKKDGIFTILTQLELI